jgi:hypothetical protein
MGQFFDEIPESVLEWLKKQEMFWVATAPLSAEGHVHVSPKVSCVWNKAMLCFDYYYYFLGGGSQGIKDTIHAISKNKFWYEDLSGSGAETIAHLRDNPRITILFHAFEGPPRVCRLFGKGNFRLLSYQDVYRYLTSPNLLQVPSTNTGRRIIPSISLMAHVFRALGPL